MSPTHAGVQLVYPTAPLKLRAADVPGFSRAITTTAASVPDGASAGAEDAGDIDAWAWWRKDPHTGAYGQFDVSLDFLATVLKTEGPFAGVIGFSQGAAVAALLVSLLEPGRRDALAGVDGGIPVPASFIHPTDAPPHDRMIHPPMKFAVAYSGFAVLYPAYAGFYDPPIHTPVLHVLGSLDSIVDEQRSLDLVERCDGKGDRGRVVYHPGGHFLPCQKPYLNTLVAFLTDALAADDHPADGGGGGDGVGDHDERESEKRSSRI